MNKEIRPDYYKSEDGKLEAFDVIDAFSLNFNLGNAFKYIVRAGKKYNKVNDLRKAVTYLNREIEKAEKEAPFEAFKNLPVDDREEEKKFYLRHRYLRAKDGSEQYLYISFGSGMPFLQKHIVTKLKKYKFTLKEIEEIKEKFNTDLADFEEVEVEE